MLAYIARRLILIVPMVLVMLTVLFMILHLSPGDPASQLMNNPDLPPEAIQQFREKWHLDDPLFWNREATLEAWDRGTGISGAWDGVEAGFAETQYWTWLFAFLTGDMGKSLHKGRPVLSVILDFLPNTIWLSTVSIVLIYCIGVSLGTIQAVRQYSLMDNVASGTSLFFYSMPSFWLALMLILLLSLKLDLLPESGMHDIRYLRVDLAVMGIGEKIVFWWGWFLDSLQHTLLPAFALGIAPAAGVARYMRTSLLEVLNQDYIRTARSKGLQPKRVIFKHALRNALLAVITLFGLTLPFLFSGAVLVEQVFGWPGMGQLIVEAIFVRDYPLVMANAFFFALLVMVGNLISDILYAVADPRIRYS